MDFNLYRKKTYASIVMVSFLVATLIAVGFVYANVEIYQRYARAQEEFHSTQAWLYVRRWAVVAVICFLCGLASGFLDWVLLKIRTRITRFVELSGHSVTSIVNNDGTETVTAEFTAAGNQTFEITLPRRPYDGSVALNETFNCLFELRFDRHHRLIGAKLIG